MGGAYYARSLLANAQRCINLFPEQNPQDAPFPVTHYTTPGLTLQVSTPDGGPIRYIYLDSHNNLYVVSGPNVYNATYNGASSWSLALVGQLNTINGPVRATDNGANIIFCDGTSDGFTLNIASQAWAQITQAAWYGSQSADVMDGFMIFGWPGNGEMYCTLDNSITFDATYSAAKNGAPDLIQAIAVVHREIWLLGSQTTEIWMNVGGETFPFARIPGVFIQQGVAAVWSVAKANENIFWVGQGPQGKAMPYMGANYQAIPIGTPAIVNEWQTYSTIADAVGFTYQLGSHIFYVVTFPLADKTWVYDVTTQQWHEWNWMDTQGVFHRTRANTYCQAFGLHLVGDWQNGNIYSLDVNNGTDNGAPIRRVRSFPHSIDDEFNYELFYSEFVAAVEVGNGPAGTQTNPPAPPQLNLRYSSDGGKSWGQYVQRDVGLLGQTSRNVKWQRLGRGRDRVWELSWAHPYKMSLNGAFVSAQRGRK
jgi:hypothetical protein